MQKVVLKVPNLGFFSTSKIHATTKMELAIAAVTTSLSLRSLLVFTSLCLKKLEIQSSAMSHWSACLRDWLYSFSRNMLRRLHHLHSNFTTCKIPRFEKTLPPQWDPNFERSSCKDPANFDWSLYTHFLHPDWSQINLSVANVFVSPTARYKKYPQNGRNLLGLEVNSSGTVQGLDDCHQNL